MSLILCMSLLTGCGNVAYTFPYDVNSSVSSFNVLAGTGAGRAEPFAADLCVVTEDQTGDGSVDMSQASAAVLFDVNNKKVLYSKNAHERLYPASLTKVMTALVALQNASPDTVLTATDSVKITESGAQLCGLKAGDTMTLDQALHILLMYSANDAAMLIAENIGGSVFKRDSVQTPDGEKKLALVEFGGFLLELIEPPAGTLVPSGEGSIPHFAVYVDDLDKTAADLKAAGVISFTAPEKKVLPNTFGGLQNWFFTGPSGEQIELLQML